MATKTYPGGFAERTHRLKTIQPFFNDVKARLKTFELRLNDRDYKVGDRIDFYEYPEPNPDCIPMFARYITYVLTDFPGLTPGYAILGIT